ncbi:MAG: hypothetical protein RJB38_2433 [Pseudomonadota bacterium]|jgi:uncharacterized protein (TIGR02722 family)
MSLQRSLVLWAFLAVLSSGLISCGPKAFTKGEYDDPQRVALLDDKFNEADMQQMADTIVQAMIQCDSVATAAQRPVVAVEKVANRTEEHIDTSSLTDKIRTALIKSKKVRFVDKAGRSAIEEEYQYGEGGNVAAATAKKRGKQTGVDYLLGGSLATNVQQVGNDKLIYYKLTMNLTHVESSEIDCTEEREIRKKYRKRSVGL